MSTKFQFFNLYKIWREKKFDFPFCVISQKGIYVYVKNPL